MTDAENILETVDVHGAVSEFMDDPNTMGMTEGAEEIRHFFGEERAPRHNVRVSIP
jgi:hypothetical protein